MTVLGYLWPVLKNRIGDTLMNVGQLNIQQDVIIYRLLVFVAVKPQKAI